MIRSFFIILLFIVFIPVNLLYSEDFFDFNTIRRERLKKDNTGKSSQKIYFKNDILYCTGDSKAASTNNRAAKFMEEGDYLKAIDNFQYGLKYAPLFFPYRYNIGICYIHANNLKLAMLNMEKAKNVVPEFSKTYLQIGYILNRQNKEDKAIRCYRKALRLNEYELDTFILIGDIYFKRNQYKMAENYYSASLKKMNRFPDGLLGQAKIFFKEGKYIKSIVLLKSIDQSKKYSKALHFYFAEAAFRLGDYKRAAEEYEKLLKFKNDRFFLEKAPILIINKLNLTKKFLID